MDAKVITITPEMAQKWLLTSPGNPRWPSGSRFVDAKVVSSISEDIKRGKWNPGNNSIAFDCEGRLVDGHHRLSAIVSAGIPVESVVVIGVGRDAQTHIDEARARTQSQRLSVSPNIVAAANSYLRGIGIISKGTTGSAELVSQWIRSHPLVFDAAQITKAGGGPQISSKGCVVASATLALESQVSSEKLREFFRSVNSGFITSSKESAAIVIRNLLLSNRRRDWAFENAVFLSVQDAIYDYVKGKPRTRAYSSPKGMYMPKLCKLNPD